MRNIRRFLIALLTGISACLFVLNAPGASAEEKKRVKVLTSFYPMYIMALNVAKDVAQVSVSNLTPAFSGCLHDYALTALDMKRIADADIFVANGVGTEVFLDSIIARYPKLKVARLSDAIAFIREDNEINPHVWVSISNAIREVKNLGLYMERFDSSHAELYRKNTAAYVSKLEALREKMHSELAAYRDREMITFHEAFPYFAQEFGFKVAAVVQRNPGSEPSAKELARIISLVRNLGIKALFSEPQYPAQAAEVIARETGAKVYILNPAVTGPDDPDSYIRIMEENLGVLKEAFQ